MIVISFTSFLSTLKFIWQFFSFKTFIRWTKNTRDVSEVIFFSLMISISQILIHYICMYNGQRHQKEQKIKLQTPFKKSLILGMKNDVEKKITQILHYFSLFSPIIIISNLQSWKKKFVNFCKVYIHIK